MPILDKPIHQRHGYREGDPSRPDAVQRDLAALATKHGLSGCVLIQFDFTASRIGGRSWGRTEKIMRAMDTLGARILTDIDDGRHDPLEQLPAEGRG